MPFKDTESLRSLKALIREQITIHGPTCDLNHIDVSQVPSMGGLFEYTEFNGDISRWNVSNVTCMERMFFDSRFNGDISQWDISNVHDMRYLFAHSDFKGDLSKWNIAQLQLAENAFGHEVHDSPLGYLCILQGYSDFPKNHPRAAQFQQLRAVAASLDLDGVGAALFIYSALHPTDWVFTASMILR